MYENQPTKLTLEHEGVTMSWEGPWDSSIEDIMAGFVGCLRGVTFGEWVIRSIKEWCEENLPEEGETFSGGGCVASAHMDDDVPVILEH